jgi:hypothetical protein
MSDSLWQPTAHHYKYNYRMSALDERLVLFYRTLNEVEQAAAALRDLVARGAFLNRLDHFCTVDEVKLTCMVRDATVHAEIARTQLYSALDMLQQM